MRNLLEVVGDELGRSASERDTGRAISAAMLQQQVALAEAEPRGLSAFPGGAGRIRR